MWFNNMIVFSLWYWEFDRGGPAERAAARCPAELRLPRERGPRSVPEGWVPTYPDYLYLAYTNATAFSPTDTLPVRLWAKMTMMLQSASLVVAILVVARAINIL